MQYQRTPALPLVMVSLRKVIDSPRSSQVLTLWFETFLAVTLSLNTETEKHLLCRVNGTLICWVQNHTACILTAQLHCERIVHSMYTLNCLCSNKPIFVKMGS